MKSWRFDPEGAEMYSRVNRGVKTTMKEPNEKGDIEKSDKKQP